MPDKSNLVTLALQLGLKESQHRASGKNQTFKTELYSVESAAESDLNWVHENFSRNGIVFLGKLLPDDVYQEAESRVNQKLSDGSSLKELHNLHLSDEWFSDFVKRKEFVNVAKILLGVSSVKVFTSMLLNKPPQAKMVVPWHQDAAYDWPISPTECASLWLAFDDVTIENGAMEVALGAHKSIFEMEETKFSNDSQSFLLNQVARSIPEKSLTGFEKIYVEMKKGCATFHHSLLPHRSSPNLSNTRRCALGVRYCRGDAVLKKYPGMKREAEYKSFELLACEEI